MKAYDHDPQVLEQLKSMQDWNGFARSLVRQHAAKGDLSVTQWMAADRMLQKMAANKATKDALTVKVDVSKVEDLFDVALRNGLRRPRFRAGGVVLSLAGPNSRNAGAASGCGVSAAGSKSTGAVRSSSRFCGSGDLLERLTTRAPPLGNSPRKRSISSMSSGMRSGTMSMRRGSRLARQAIQSPWPTTMAMRMPPPIRMKSLISKPGSLTAHIRGL